MSHNVAFCISSYSHRFNENLSVYGGCAHFDAYPHHFLSDPFGATRELNESTIYKEVNRVSWYGCGETLAYNCQMIPSQKQVKLYIIYCIMRE